MRFPLHSSTHHVECGREACGPEEVTDLERCGRMVDYTAVDGEARVDDEDLDIWWKTVL